MSNSFGLYYYYVRYVKWLERTNTKKNSIPIVTKDIAILRLSVISGGHLAFPHEIENEKMETVFSQFIWVSISEKNTII